MFYIDLFSALARHKVDYLLIGGLAVSLHGVERATMDVDITVAMSPVNPVCYLVPRCFRFLTPTSKLCPLMI